jgi:DNA adenine methylase
MSETVQRPTRPIARYLGGKWRLAPWIISHFPAHKVYVEPFGGAGSVLLRKERSYAEIYNDLDGEMVNLFRCMRDEGQALVNSLQLTPFSREEYFHSFELAPVPMEQARRTVIRSFLGFASNSINRQQFSGFRCSAARPPAREWRNFPSAATAIIDRLRGVVIENRHAWEVMQQHDSPETLHYVDPPYLHATRGQRADHRLIGYTHELTDEQHRALAYLLGSLSGMVIVSGYPSALYNEIFAGWHRVQRAAYADGARPRTECLWLNDAATKGHQP